MNVIQIIDTFCGLEDRVMLDKQEHSYFIEKKIKSFFLPFEARSCLASYEWWMVPRYPKWTTNFSQGAEVEPGLW